jgi:hypothetical protein
VPDTPSPPPNEAKTIAFMKGTLVFVTGQRSLVEWELKNSGPYEGLSKAGQAEIDQAKKDHIAELKRRAA